jgi:hypothetical protein
MLTGFTGLTGLYKTGSRGSSCRSLQAGEGVEKLRTTTLTNPQIVTLSLPAAVCLFDRLEGADIIDSDRRDDTTPGGIARF